MSQKNPQTYHTVVSQEDGQPFPVLVTPVTGLSIKNGSTGGLAVRLSCQPGSNVTVKTTVVDGAGRLTVSAGASLTFTSGNWNTPQGVTLQSTAGAAGSFRVLVAPSGADLPGFAAVGVSCTVC